MLSYATAVTAAILIVVAWVGVQRGWRRSFPSIDGEQDALAGRDGCAGCDRRDEHARAGRLRVAEKEER